MMPFLANLMEAETWSGVHITAETAMIMVWAWQLMDPEMRFLQDIQAVRQKSQPVVLTKPERQGVVQMGFLLNLTVAVQGNGALILGVYGLTSAMELHQTAQII